MFLVGISLPITNGPLFAALQAVVAPDMQGRVFTLIASVASAMTPIGLLVAGPVADAFGVQTWYLLGGLMTFIMALVGLCMPAVRHFEDHRNQSPEDPELAPVPVEIEIE
jgi:DHA3 family macrolide efflux protein-like MFS transporter